MLKVERWSPKGQNSGLCNLSTLRRRQPTGRPSINERSDLRLLGQVSSEISSEVLRDFLRGAVQKILCDVIALEVSEICGEKYQPGGSDVFRAGSSVGRVLIEGDRDEVIKLRVRKRLSDGATREVALKSYVAANDPKQLQKDVVTALMAGVSTRLMAEVKPKSPSVSRSSVSRLWQVAGSNLIDELRSRDLAPIDWCVLQLDGVRLSSELLAIVAIGIDTTGAKHVLDFALGGSENLEVARELITRIRS